MRAGLLSRSKLIWSQSSAAQRRGYFLAGVGLTAGHDLDAIAEEANSLLVNANAALLVGDGEEAIDLITSLAERVFAFNPFTPSTMPENWRELLRWWLLGKPLAELAVGQESKTLHFIEGGLVYRLPWAMEALRVRAGANGDVVGDNGVEIEDYDLGLAVPAVETGTMNRSASILIQAGFTSRLAAIKAVTDTRATFTTGRELRAWLNSGAVAARSALPDWPTAETKSMWTKLVSCIRNDCTVSFECLQNLIGGFGPDKWLGALIIDLKVLSDRDVVGDNGVEIEDYDLGLAVPAVETGTMNRSASILIQAGFTSRLAAIKAVTDTRATFTTGRELRAWLNSGAVAARSALPDWPTAETKSMWTKLVDGFMLQNNRTWTDRRYWSSVVWSGTPPRPGTPVQLHQRNGQCLVLAADGLPLGILQAALNPHRRGLIHSTVSAEAGRIDLVYLGPDDLSPE